MVLRDGVDCGAKLGATLSQGHSGDKQFQLLIGRQGDTPHMCGGDGYVLELRLQLS